MKELAPLKPLVLHKGPKGRLQGLRAPVLCLRKGCRESRHPGGALPFRRSGQKGKGVAQVGQEGPLLKHVPDQRREAIGEGAQSRRRSGEVQGQLGHAPTLHGLPLPVEQVPFVVDRRGPDDRRERKGRRQTAQVQHRRALRRGPAQRRQVGDQGLGQEPPFAVLANGRRARPFAQLLPVRREDHGDMGKGRTRPPHPVQDRELARRVGDVFIPADNVGDVHQMIVHGGGEQVGHGAVVPLKDEVADRPSGEGLPPTDEVVEGEVLVRQRQAPAGPLSVGDAASGLLRGESAAPTVVPRRFSPRQLVPAQGGQSLLRAETGVDRPDRPQMIHLVAIEGSAFALPETRA